jgi:S-adenosylmethionine:tRNA ribosyltransferase-isomerase
VLTSDFDFQLPAELIAQAPLPARDGSRLLHLRRGSGRVTHRQFSQFAQLLRPGDLLVLNDARVIPARLLGKKLGTGGKVELLLVRPTAQLTAAAALEAPEQVEWQCLGQASKGLRAGAQVEFEGGLRAEISDALGGGEYRVRFVSPLATLEAALALAGKLPLPPYIERAPDASDSERYQTVFARAKGSVAAPTAGLHFTPALLASLGAAGIDHAFVTLDVGPGTFLPVREGALADHKMHSERCVVSAPTATAVNAARRVVAVGTTVVRTLESMAGGDGQVSAGERDTALFILPGFEFRAVDALLTNFHLPKSTLLMLVSAFAGRGHVLAAYAEAVREKYRFFSYGDAMFIEDDG